LEKWQKVLYLSRMKTLKISPEVHKALKVFCAGRNANMTVMADYAILDMIEMEEKKPSKKTPKIKSSNSKK
jgi:hypothetical protein